MSEGIIIVGIILMIIVILILSGTITFNGKRADTYVQNISLPHLDIKLNLSSDAVKPMENVST